MWQKCGVFTLLKAGLLNVLPFGHYGDPFKRLSSADDDYVQSPLDHDDVFVLHKFVCLGTEGYTWTTASDAVKALFRNEKLKRFKLIFTGDNHVAFTKGGQSLVDCWLIQDH